MPALTLTLGNVYIYTNHDLESFDLSALETVKGSIIVTNNIVLPTFTFPSVVSVGLEAPDAALGGNIYVTGNELLTDFALPALYEIGDFLEVNSNVLLATIDAPTMFTIGKGLRVINNPSLTSWTFDALAWVGTNVRVEYNSAFPQCLAEALVTAIESKGALGGEFHSTGNQAGCTCEQSGETWEASCPD